MQIQNQAQQIAEEFLLPLSENELEIVRGGASVGTIRLSAPKEWKKLGERFSVIYSATNLTFKDLGKAMTHLTNPR